MSLEHDEHKPVRLRATILVLLALTAAGFAGFKWLTAATPISKGEALQIFEKNNAAAGPQEIAAALKDKPDRRRGERPRNSVETKNRDIRKTRNRTEARAGSLGEAGSLKTRSTSVAAQPMAVPAEGVYAYLTEGSEQISGYELRRFPSRSYRNIVHTGPRSWTEHHTHMREHQGWTGFRLEGSAVVADWTRQRIVFGPVVEDETLEFHTPLPLTLLPWESGRNWNGAVDGETNDGPFQGSYSASTGTRSRLRVGDEVIEVWLDELSLVLHGADFDATLELRRWISPEYGVTVREEVVADARKGPLTYTADWTLDLLSTQPER